jgi:hypothetical protein
LTVIIAGGYYYLLSTGTMSLALKCVFLAVYIGGLFLFNIINLKTFTLLKRGGKVQ